jgi:hypothetical protein
MFNGNAGDVVLGALLLALLPGSFLLAAFFLLWRWLQHPAVNTRRAIFVLHRDPLAAQIAARTPGTTPGATPRTPALEAPGAGATPRAGGDSAGGSDAGGSDSVGLKGGSSAEPGTPQQGGLSAEEAAALAAASRRRWSFLGLARTLCGARAIRGDWCGINLDSR